MKKSIKLPFAQQETESRQEVITQPSPLDQLQGKCRDERPPPGGKFTPQFTALEDETRPTVDTAAAAHYLHLAQQTLRIWSSKGCGALRPRRLPGSSKLHWMTSEIRELLGVTNHG